MKCFDELFTREEFKLANNIRATYDCGYSPIVLNATSQVTVWCGFGISRFQHMTLRFYYATQVWQEALLKLSEEIRSDYSFGSPKWERGKDDERGFNFINFEENRNTDFKSAVARFWKVLKEVADSKKIFVSENIIRRNETLLNKYFYGKEEIKISYIVDRTDICDWHGHSPDLSDYKFSSKKKTYSWNEIKDLFVEISPRILSLVHYRKMNYYNPNDTATIALHKACKALDIISVKKALEKGADPNGFDKYGNTPMNVCVQDFFYYENLSNGKYRDKTQEEIKNEIDLRNDILALLLENGADIDYFGADVQNALTETYFPEAPEIMEFLLKNGANPNHNTSLIDEPWKWYVNSDVLRMVLERISFEEMEDGKANERLLAMKKLLKEYGAKEYIDGFNPDDYFK